MAIWVKKKDVLRVLQKLDVPQSVYGEISGMPASVGDITRGSRWIKLGKDDPRLDDTDRAFFADETYCCEACGAKEYFGASCKRGRYCQACGARMQNAGDRALEEKEEKGRGRKS